MNIENMSDDELISVLEYDDNPTIRFLIGKLETSVNEYNELSKETENLITLDQAVSLVGEVGSEDFNANLIRNIKRNLKANKNILVSELEDVIEVLESQDLDAGRLIEAIKDGSAL